MVLAIVTPTFAAPPINQPIREIFVPFDDLNVLLQGDAERVFLTRDEYEDLIAQAKQTTVEHAPRQTLLLSADYLTTIEDQRAAIHGTLWIEILEPGLHAIPLELSGVGIRRAILDDEPASLGRDATGKIAVFVDGVGKHRLELDLVTTLQTSAAQQSLAFALPTPAATKLRVIVPGNVEVRSGAAVVSRVVEQGRTRFELLPRPGPLSLVMSLNNKLLLEQRVVMARSVIVDEMTQAYERLHATVSMGMLHGAVDEFRFRIPVGFEITNVSGPSVARWLVGEQADERTLEVVLREPTTGTVVLNIAAVNNTPVNITASLQGWKMPRLEPLDVANHVAVIGLLVENRLAVESIAATGLIAIDNEFLRSVLPESLFQVDPGAPQIRPVAAFYAPQDQFELSARFTRPPAQVAARLTMLMTVGEKQQQIRATIALTPTHEKLFSVHVTVPDNWRIATMTLEDGSPVSFERQSAEIQSSAAANTTRLRVTLPTGVASGTETKLLLEATSVPNGWLEEWTETNATFPVFSIEGVAATTGAIAIQSQDDLVPRPDELVGLTTLGDADRKTLGLGDADGTLAYRIVDSAYSATFAIHRQPPRITARSFSFLKVEPEGLSAHYEIAYDVQQASTRTLRFQLPEVTPESLSVRGLDGVQVKEYSSRLVDGRREWTVSLAASAIGQVRLAIDFVQPLPDNEPQDWMLPVVRAANVAYQSAIVAVEGSPEFDARIEANGRKIDVGELVDADYQVGGRLLGAFGFIVEPQVTINIMQRPGYALPAAITERAELVTLVAASGGTQTAARYLLRTKAAFLQISLPPGATLWSASVDGKPSTPQRDGDDLVISLPPTAMHALRDLQIVYESQAASIAWAANIHAAAPRLVVRMDNGDDRYEVPTADVSWHLVLPDGHRIVRSDGSVFTDALSRPRNPATFLAGILNRTGTLYRLGGGIGRIRMLREMNRVDPTASVRQTIDSQPMSAESEDSAAADHESMFAVPATPMLDAQMDFDAATTFSDALAAYALVPENESPNEEALALGLPAKRAVPKRAALAKKYWALQGVRSLQIQLERSGQQIAFHGMGVRPELRATLVHTHRLGFLAWAIAILVAAWGMTKTNRRIGNKFRFVVVASGVALSLPPAIGLLTGLELNAMFAPMLYATMLLVPYYFVASVVRWLVTKASSRITWTTAVATTASLLLLVTCSATFAEEEAGSTFDVSQLRTLLQPDRTITLPTNAVIIPYDANDADGVENAEKVLVSYAEYARLWKLAFPHEPLAADPPPAPYAMANATYTATLEGEDFLLIRGRMDLDVYQQSPIDIPLPLAGGVLERATLDGESARLRIITPQPTIENQQAPPVSRPPSKAFALLHVDSPGRKRLELAIRLPIQRRGGWRIVRGQLPTAPATELTLDIPDARTELRLSGTLDRASFVTEQPNESIATALPANGDLRLQWRPAIAARQVDQTLTARSTGVLDIQEDGIRLVWRIELETRNNQRETFTFIVPKSYLVERVVGDNVRGWQSRTNGDEQQIDVTLLKAATGTETITLRLSHRRVIGLGEATNFTAPAVTIPDAMLHQGQLAIRRSPLLDVRTQQASGLSRIELEADALSGVLSSVNEESPLGLKSFKAYRFGASTFQLRLSAREFTSQISVQEQTVLRIGDRAAEVETRMKLSIGARPVHQLEIELADGFDLKQVVAPGEFDWAITSVDGASLLTVYLASGILGEMDLDLRGSVAHNRTDGIANPRFVVRNAVSQSGFIAVQVDPAVAVVAEQRENIETSRLSQVTSWLAAPQRSLTRLILFHRTADYKVRFRITPRQARVDVQSVTNVRVTPREIEELIFLKFFAQGAGVREVSFLLPASLDKSQITVPLLRQTTITPVDGNAGQVRVRLELQDPVIGELIVLVQNSRSLTAGDYVAPVPTIETGSTDFRYVVIESAGRDEVVVTKGDDFLELNRQLSQWKHLAQILPGNITQAYVARDNVTNPQLSITTKQRATVETAGASIGLAQTLLLVDANGAYRGRQEYRVDNKTEQFLEVELPEHAELWTVFVAGEAVKPTVVPQLPNRVRVPLIKTQTGDLDYSVVLKYGGDLNRLRSLRTISFPLMKTVNINVQQSHVRLRLPQSQRWFNFTGSLRPVTDAGELAADYVSYQTKQVQRLMRVINSDSYDAFSKVRAENSVKMQVQRSSREGKGLFGDLFRLSSNARLQSELKSNRGVVQEAEQQIQQTAQAAPEAAAFGNGFRLKQLYDSQATNRANDVVDGLEYNFDRTPQEQSKSVAADEQRFNFRWFYSNQLGKNKSKDEKAIVADSRLATRADKAPASKPASRVETDFLKANKKEQQPADEHRDGLVGGEVSQVLRYQQRLETQNESRQLGRFGRSVDAIELAERKHSARHRAAGLGGQLEEQLRDNAISGGGGGFGGGSGGPMAGREVADRGMGIPSAAAEAGFASLDVVLPERGVEFLFTTPRGDLQITAQSISTAQIERGSSLLTILGLLIVAAIGYRVVRGSVFVL